MLPLHALSAKDETIRRQKINAQHLISWSLINTADFVANIPRTGRRNSRSLVVLFSDATFRRKDPSILGCNQHIFILDELTLLKIRMQASSSNGRASDSKSGGWGFESLLACHFLIYEAQRSKVRGCFNDLSF